MLNQFLEIDGCGNNLGAIAADQDCLVIPIHSQVNKIRIVPDIVEKGTDWDWTEFSDWLSITDNTYTDNTKAKYLKGIGGRPEPTVQEVDLPQGKKATDYKRFRLEFTVFISEDAVYTLLRQLHGWTGFRFWYETVGGKRIGGENGIKPQNVTTYAAIYGAGRNDIESGRIIIEWIADSEADRCDVTTYSTGHLVDDEGSPLVDENGDYLIG
ncbi:hypothetical protein KC887_08645 [Candidatus Kaiserbacteria bacterium]|nr:hypothetical protein [Candidatus Kaiserbacteria bacterium]